MDPEELISRLRQAPFEAFLLCVSDGTTYEVRHPEQILVGRRACHVGIGANGGPFQRIAVVSNVHVTRIEPIPSSNGKKR